MVICYIAAMRIISKRTIKEFWIKYPDSEQSLKAWATEVESGNWNSPNDIKNSFASASVLTGKRIVFNIGGNKYRLITDIEFRLKIVFVVWIATHKEYDNTNIKKVRYVKANKK